MASDQKHISSQLPELHLQCSWNLNFSLFVPSPFMSLLSSPHLLLFKLPVLVLSCCIQLHTNSHRHIHSSLSSHIQLQIMELTDPLTGSREREPACQISDRTAWEKWRGQRRRGEEGRRRGEERTSYWNGNRTGQLKHFTRSLFASPAQLLQIIYTAHYGAMNMNKLNSTITMPPLSLN